MAKAKKHTTPTPAKNTKTPKITQVNIHLATGQLVGLGSDNCIYVWEAYDGTWKLNKLSPAERANFDAKRAANEQAGAPAPKAVIADPLA